MSDLLTHWAIFDDARRLLRIDSHIEPLLREIVDETESIARLGALARGGNWWTGRILREARDAPKPDDAHWRQKLGFGLGGLLHYPADYEFKPMIAAMMKKTGLGKREVSAYAKRPQRRARRIRHRAPRSGHERLRQRFAIVRRSDARSERVLTRRNRRAARCFAKQSGGQSEGKFGRGLLSWLPVGGARGCIAGPGN